MSLLGSMIQAVSGLAGPWAFAVIGLLACAKPVAFIGLAIPGEAALQPGGFPGLDRAGEPAGDDRRSGGRSGGRGLDRL